MPMTPCAHCGNRQQILIVLPGLNGASLMLEVTITPLTGDEHLVSLVSSVAHLSALSAVAVIRQCLEELGVGPPTISSLNSCPSIRTTASQA